jgi:hypothetical protein
MTNPWQGISDAEFVELKRRHGDFVLECPWWAQDLVRDLRNERGEPLLEPVPEGTVIH